jgi:catechol 2,3-dioxygenase-like lactoylglutathione lyase family enzyme
MRQPRSRARKSALALAALVLASNCQRIDPNSRPVGVEPRATARTEGQSKQAVRHAPIVRELVLNVADLDRSLKFFQALDFALVDELYVNGAALGELLALPSAEARVARLRLGSERVELRQFIAPLGRVVREDSHSNDQTFQHMAIVVRDMDAAFAAVERQGAMHVSPAPQTIPASNPVAGGIRAYYFKDPDGHALELIWFPEGKGRARWRAHPARLFLGIDHSAIAVSDTERSLPFYKGLGFVVAGESLNFGKEQEALSGVSGARVRITGLAPLLGPAVEFLSYLAPGPGRSTPADSATNDLWHWEISVEVDELEGALRAVERAGGKRLSPSSVELTGLDLGYRHAALVTDSDGHCLRLVQR